jgi:aldose 1-epimerase
MITERAVDGFSALTLGVAEGSDIEATFVPDAGMVGCSLRHRGEELLGQREGLRRFVRERSTMGIPLLHPWANRLARKRFTVAGREIDLESDALPLSLDPNGLPIHGLLAGARGWRVERQDGVAGGALLSASFDFAAHEDLLAAFPFPHELFLEATLTGRSVRIATRVRASGDASVPISFGYHPYLRLPGADRSDWRIDVPVRERLVLDRLSLPIGEREPTRVESGPLGSRTFDDAYVAPEDAAPLVLEGGGRRIEVSFASGYPYAQVYAPANDDVVAFEPMTAPTNALVAGGPDLPLVAPGDSYDAVFSITVADEAG